MLSFPFRDGREPVPKQESAPGRLSDPRRNALPFGFGRIEHLRVNIRVDGDGELYGWIPSRHTQTILPW
jgi:hypothetical protein